MIKIIKTTSTLVKLNFYPSKFNSQLFSTKMVKYLNQNEAINIDQELFNTFKFSVDQLMELAGQACAVAVAKTYPASKSSENRILICCGPGNNGGDGLVCARHLKLFGYEPEIYYPKKTTGNQLYENLLHQCVENDIKIVDKFEEIRDSKDYKVIVDALFGFSFKPPVRENFLPIMGYLTAAKSPICSVDIPSGWDVEAGPPEQGAAISPDVLVSLTAPKLCARKFQGRFHYLGGRFVPKKLEVKYDMQLPEYPSTDLVVLL